MPNIDAVIPPLRSSSIYYSKSSELPEEYSIFLDKYKEGNILMAFGTTFPPRMDQVVGLLEGAKVKPDTGFIISLKENYETYKVV